jgi:putative transcriptional regulator
MTEAPEHRISVHLDELLQAKGMTLVEVSSRVGVTVVNLSILKNGRARGDSLQHTHCHLRRPRLHPGELLRLDH